MPTKPKEPRIKAIAPHVLTFGVCLLVCGLRAETPVPMTVPDFAQHKVETVSQSARENDLSMAIGQHIQGHRTRGSDQNFELDTFVHEGASTPWAMVGISNLLIAPGAHVKQAQSNRVGGHIAGTLDEWTLFPATVDVAATGRIGRLTEFRADYPAQGVGEKWSFVDTDPASRHVLRGRTLVDQVDFSNGWSFRTNGDSLELWDARGVIHIFR